MNIFNTKNLRKINQEKVIDVLLTKESCQKNELAKLTGLSLGSINNILADLLEDGKVKAIGYNESTGGRRSMNYQINQNYSRNLCISLYKDSKDIQLSYRLYDLKENILEEQIMIQSTIEIEDIYQIIDNQLLKYDNIKVIGISIPGIIDHGYVHSTMIEGFDNIELYHLLEKSYSQTIIIENDVNTAAVGFYLFQKNYENVCFLFQPQTTMAGVGMIIHGQLLRGKNHLAGEVQFLPYLDNLNGEELIEAYVQTLITVLDPEVIGIYSPLQNYDLLIKHLEKIFDNKNLPKLIKIDHMIDFIFKGTNQMCQDALKSNLVIMKKTII